MDDTSVYRQIRITSDAGVPMPLPRGWEAVPGAKTVPWAYKGRSILCRKIGGEMEDGNVFIETKVDENYVDLFNVFVGALERASKGKGAQRHGNGRKFIDQYIITAGKHHGVGSLLYQVGKKAQEVERIHKLNGKDAAINELRDIIVYAAAAIIVTQDQE